MNSNALYWLFVIATSFLLVFVKKSGYMEKRINTLYLCGISLNIFIFLCYIGRFYAEQYHIVWLSYLVNTLAYITGPSILYFLLICICNPKELLVKIATGLEILQLILCVTTPFTTFYFTISEDGIYARGPFYKLSFIIACIFGTVWIVRMWVKFNFVEFNDKFYIVFMAFLGVSSMILSAYDERYKLEYFGSTFVFMLFYVFMIETDGKYDKMTGVLSRRMFYNITSQTIKKNENYSIMLFDANGLKHVNDNWGHKSGDILIQQLAASLKGVFSRESKIFRLGGDEFVAIVDTTDEGELQILADKIHSDLKERSNRFIFEISTSVGTAVHLKNETLEATLGRADANMYQNKETYYQITRKARRE